MRRTSVDSAASMPIASTDECRLVLTEQLLRINRSFLGGRSHTRLQDRDRLQIIAAAHSYLFAVQQRSFELIEQHSFLRLLSRPAPHQPRQLPVLPKNQPTLKHVQRAAFADKPGVKFLPAFEPCVTR